MMVLVRKNELACREHWDGGLWEPREMAEPVAVTKSPPTTLGAEAPVSDHLREQYTDRVTSVGVAPTSRPIAEIVEPAQPSGHAESAGFVASPPVERTLPASERPQVVARQESPAPSSALRRESWGGPMPEMTRNETSRPASAESQPPRRPVEPSPAPAPRQAPREDNFSRSWGAPRTFDEDQIRPVTPRRTDIEKRASRVEPAPVPRPRPRDEHSSDIDDLSHLLSRPTSREAPSAPPSKDPDIERFGAKHPTVSAAPPPSQDAPISGGRRGWTEPFETAHQPPKRSAETPRSQRLESEPETHQPVQRQQPEPAKVALNAKLASMPQCCGTCRDFRPAEGGERGWCNNPYAFDHRRMVRKNDLACRSTIGDWWIPSDDWWMQQADYSHHGRPTPIVDDLLRQLLDSRANGTNARNNGRG
jgi:hypothetical protein